MGVVFPKVDPGHHYPQLKTEHLSNARLFATRDDMVQHLKRPTDTIAEIGVAFGDFSKVLASVFAPRRFVAFDMFNMHTFPTVWGMSTEEVFKGVMHNDWYKGNVDVGGADLVLEVGMSQENLLKYDDETFDLIYVDGDHTYESVCRDAELAERKVKRDGMLIFNDYILYDHFGQYRYGVVPVVNTLVASSDWKVVALAMHQQMFCDIALTR